MIKETIKNFIPESLFEFLLMIKNTVRFFGIQGFLKEISFRLKKSPDGYPIPPSRLIFFAVGHGMMHDYYHAGEMVANDMIDKMGPHCNISKLQNVLDFGCGCGRLIRHFHNHTKADLYGSDYNAEVIEWDTRFLPFAKFNNNQHEPGLPYQNSFFDLVYMVSIFTHMTEDLQKKWTKEFARIIKGGGILLFTSHGGQFTKVLSGPSLENYNNGKWAYTDNGPEGSNYFGSYFNHVYVEENMTDDFTLLTYVPGRENTDLMQDIYILKRK